MIIGFGLLFTYFNKNIFTGLFTSIFTVSITVIITPFFEKFWYNVFITNFNGDALTPTNPTRLIDYSLGGIPIYLDYYNLKIVIANSISTLITSMSFYGRLNPIQIITNIIGFNFTWNLCYFLCCLLVKNSPDNRLFDDYQISNIYVFAAIYGIIANLIIGFPSIKIQYFQSSKNSQLTAHVGVFFLFLAFATTSTMYPLKFALA